jgi:hypothetical protein
MNTVQFTFTFNDTLDILTRGVGLDKIYLVSRENPGTSSAPSTTDLNFVTRIGWGALCVGECSSMNISMSNRHDFALENC